MQLTRALSEALDLHRGRVRVGFPWWLRLFLARDVVAITLGRTIYVLPAFLLRPNDEIERLIRHEIAHVRQVARLGLVRFLWRYVTEYLALRRAGNCAAEAYRRISFEVEAWEAESMDFPVPVPEHDKPGTGTDTGTGS